MVGIGKARVLKIKLADPLIRPLIPIEKLAPVTANLGSKKTSLSANNWRVQINNHRLLLTQQTSKHPRISIKSGNKIRQ